MLLAVALIVGGITSATSQAQATKAKAPAKDPQVAFNDLFDAWKKILAELRKNTLEYRAAKLANSDDIARISKEREEILARGTAMEPKIKKAAEVAYLAAPNKNNDVTIFIESLTQDAEIKEKYEEALRLANLLIDNGYEQKVMYAIAGRAAFNSNDFDTAAKDLKIAKDANVLEDAPGKQLLAMVPEYQKKWAKEKALRDAEEKADDLPAREIEDQQRGHRGRAVRKRGSQHGRQLHQPGRKGSLRRHAVSSRAERLRGPRGRSQGGWHRRSRLHDRL